MCTLTKGDLQFLAGFQKLHDRIVSLIVKANVPGKLNNSAYQGYGPCTLGPFSICGYS